MAIKSSGPLYLYLDIGRYFGRSASNVSLRSLSSAAGKSTPDYMSEFYGYSSGPTPTPIATNPPTPPPSATNPPTPPPSATNPPTPPPIATSPPTPPPTITACEPYGTW